MRPIVASARVAALGCLLVLALTACEPGVRPDGNGVILGDSIAQRSGDALVYQALLRDWAFDVSNNSIVGMGACPLQQWYATGGTNSGITDYLTRRVAALEAIASRGFWVIELGTNDASCAATYRSDGIDPLLGAIPPGTVVFWLTVSTRAGGAATINAALTQAAKDYPNLIVLPYASHFDPHPEWFDGPTSVHLSTAGEGELAKWLFAQVDQEIPEP